MKMVNKLTAVATVVAALTIAAQAHAAPLDSLTFYLTQGECTSNCGAGGAPAPISNASAVEVIINLLTNTTATVELIAPSGNIDTPAYINVNDGGTVGHVTATYYEGTVADPTEYSEGSATRSDPGQAEDHFGNMNTWTGASAHPTVTFDLTALDGLTWSSAAAVLMATTGYAAAYSQGFEAVTAAQYAGYYTTTPLPSALPLFFSGLGAMVLLGWRRKRKPSSALKPFAALATA